MRITFILPVASRTGGVRVVAIYAERLRRRGHEVTVVSRAEHAPLLRRFKDLVRGRGLTPRFSVKSSHLDETEVSHRIIRRAGPLRAEDVPDGDVVVATWWKTAYEVAALPPCKGAKAYFIQHDETFGGPAEGVYGSYGLGLHLITIAGWLVELIRARSGRGAALVPNAVDLEQFRAEERAKQARPTVGMLYSAVPFKNSRLALEAVELARRGVGDLRLVCLSADPPVGSLPVPAETDFVVNPPQHKLREVYAQCDAWLHASTTEGFGLPILEAMACRTPVIGVPSGAAPELLADGCGLLVGHGDAAAMADAIGQVAAMTDGQWRELSARAWRRATGYTWQQATDRFEAALLQAVGPGRD